MSVATVRRVFNPENIRSDDAFLQAARNKANPVIYSIKKVLHQIITLGFGKGLEQARIERREHEIGQLGTDILANLPRHEELNSQTDILLHVNHDKGYSVVQKGHLLVLYTDGLFIPDVEVLADLKDKADYTNLINKLSDVKGTDEWKAHINGLIKSVKGIEHKGLSVVKNLDNLIFECVRSNDTEFVNFAITNMNRDEHHTPAKGEQWVKAMLDTARVNDLSIKAGSNDLELMLKFFLAKNPEVSSEFATLFHKHPDLISDLSENREFRGSQYDTNLRIIYHGLKNPLSSGNTITSLAEKLTLKPALRPNGIIKPIAAFTRLHKELEDINVANGKLITSDVNELVDKSSEIEAGIYDIRQQIDGFESNKANKAYELKEVAKKISNLNEELNYVVALFNKAATAEEKDSASEVINLLENELLNLGETHDRLNHELEALKPEILVSLQDKLRELTVKKDSHIETLQSKVAHFSNKKTIRQIADRKYEQDLPATDSEGRITLEQLHKDISEAYFENIDQLIRDYKASHFYGSEESVKPADFLLTKTIEKGITLLNQRAMVTCWSHETIDSLTADILLDGASLEAAVKKMGNDLKHTAFKVVMTKADKDRRDYKNSLKGKVDDIVLRSLKRLPKMVASKDWESLEDTMEMCYTFLAKEPISKVNDLINHILAKELERFGLEDQIIVGTFKAYFSIPYPDVSAGECVMETGPNIRKLRENLTNPIFKSSSEVKEYKDQLSWKPKDVIMGVLQLELLPDLIKEQDWKRLVFLLVSYFDHLKEEPAQKAQEFLNWNLTKYIKQVDFVDQVIINAIKEFMARTLPEKAVKDCKLILKANMYFLKQKLYDLNTPVPEIYVSDDPELQEILEGRNQSMQEYGSTISAEAIVILNKIPELIKEKDWPSLQAALKNYFAQARNNSYYQTNSFLQYSIAEWNKQSGYKYQAVQDVIEDFMSVVEREMHDNFKDCIVQINTQVDQLMDVLANDGLRLPEMIENMEFANAKRGYQQFIDKYKNNLGTKHAALAILDRLPELVRNRDWQSLTRGLNDYFTALSEVSYKKANDILVSAISGWNNHSGNKYQEITAIFEDIIYPVTDAPLAPVKNFLPEIKIQVNKLKAALSGKSLTEITEDDVSEVQAREVSADTASLTDDRQKAQEDYSKFMEKYKEDLMEKYHIGISVLDSFPEKIKNKDWQGLQSSLDYYFESFDDESYIRANDLVLHTVAEFNKQSGNKYQAIVDVFEDILYPMTDELSVTVKDFMPRIKDQVKWLKENLSGEAEKAFRQSHQLQQQKPEVKTNTNVVSSPAKVIAGTSPKSSESAQDNKKLYRIPNDKLLILNDLIDTIREKEWGFVEQLLCQYYANLANESVRKVTEVLIEKMKDQINDLGSNRYKVIDTLVQFGSQVVTKDTTDAELVKDYMKKIEKEAKNCVKAINSKFSLYSLYDLVGGLVN